MGKIFVFGLFFFCCSVGLQANEDEESEDGIITHYKNLFDEWETMFEAHQEYPKLVETDVHTEVKRMVQSSTCDVSKMIAAGQAIILYWKNRTPFSAG